ncbi:conserved hypothetical protein [Gammaproteobacteria bacterium]
MTLVLSSLDILILLKCDEKNGVISKNDLGQVFRSYGTVAKERAIKKLKKYNLILVQKLPKLSSTKIPVFYKLTEKGKQWVDDYNKNYPK